MLPERPQFGLVSCPACGTDVDAVRAPRVVWLEDGPRFLCGDRCRERFARGERPFDAPRATPPQAPSAPRPSIPDLVREATQAGELPMEDTVEYANLRRPDSWVALGLGTLGLALVGLSDSRVVEWIGGFLVILCAGANMQTRLGGVRVPPPLQWLAPTGLVLATLGVLFGAGPDNERWALLACAAAGVLLSLRNPIHIWAGGQAERMGRELASTLPTWARIPSVSGNSYEEVPAPAPSAG